MEAADMRKVSAVDASFRDAGLRGANLEEAMLHEANLSWADLTGANLSGARLDHAILRASNLSGADLTGAVFYGTVLSYVDLRTVRGLDAVNHRGPSTIGLDTITRSGGDIPESFLRGAGVPDSTIAYARSIAAKPGQFYSCFISYSTKDERLAKRLYTDLQSRGVRCWFAPEDLKIGDRFRHRIDEAIRVHDKLLLLLSESSIASTWVESEVEAAFEKEQKSGKLVLFPVRLDDAVMNSTAAWAADIRRKRQIGEFQGWEHADTYERAFARLLRDLGVEGA
jgi:uncharacterized protein YjbI with pentapeptide repeats